MASNVYQIVRDAIVNKRQIVERYNDFVREMCPHCIGKGKNGQEMALFFQFAGGSKSGLPPEGEWRCIDLRELTDVTAREGQWHTDDSHKKSQTCVKQIDVEVAH
jgi:hypothetical protein